MNRPTSPKRLGFRPKPLVLAVALAISSTTAFAQTAGGGASLSTPVQFSIVAKPLGQALGDWAVQSRIQLIVQPELVAGKTAPAVSGALLPRQALDRLLAGSGLAAITQNGAVVVRAASPAVPAAPPESPEVGMLEPVVVTGERTARSLAETTSSVTVLPEAEVRRRTGKESVFQAINGAPNYTPSTPEELPVIRGERSSGPSSLGGGFLFGSTTRASLIVDDVARISSISNNSFQSIFDVEQVELLRGPQTTVRGANAIAGAYVVKTKDPTSQREGEIFTMLDWNEFSGLGYRSAAMVNTPIGDAMAARIVVERRSGRVPVDVIDGSVFDPSQPTPPPGTDLGALSDFDNTSVRGKLLLAPPTVPQLDVLLSFQSERGEDVGFDSYANGELIHGRPLTERKYIFGEQRIFNTRAQAFSVNAGWQMDSGDELRVIAATQQDKFSDNPRANQAVRFKLFDETLNTLDLLYKYGQIKTDAQGVLGATISRRKQDGVTTGFALTNRQTSDSAAVFADVSVPMSKLLGQSAQSWHLLAGGRLLRQEGSRFFDFAGLSSVNDQVNESVFLPKLGVNVELDAAQTAALTWRRGYNPGGAGVDFSSLATFRYRSEKVDALEATWRYAPKGGRTSLSANLFYNSFKDKQFQYSPTPNSSLVVNEPKSRSHGLELEASYQVNPTLATSAGLGLLRTRITEGDLALVGNRFGEDPNSTLSVSAVWKPRPGLELNARVNHISGYFSDFQNAATDRGGDYTMLDLGAAYTVGSLTLRGFINNATDKFAIGRGTIYGGYLLPPRTVGVSASVKF